MLRRQFVEDLTVMLVVCHDIVIYPYGYCLAGAPAAGTAPAYASEMGEATAGFIQSV